jgi:hypothetical protein
LRDAIERLRVCRAVAVILDIHSSMSSPEKMVSTSSNAAPGEHDCITALVKRLEARELIVRKPDAEDGRRVFLSLSGRGKRFDVPTTVSVEHAVAIALEQSTPADLTAVRRVLGRLVTALDEISAADEDA